MFDKLPESVGHALVKQRAGMEHVVYNLLFNERKSARIDIHSPAFVFNARLPIRFTADGDGISPPLEWRNVPDGTDSLALIVEDADSPTPHPLVHAIVVRLAGADGSLGEGALTPPNPAAAGLEMGQKSFFRQSWLPPDPPPGHGEHRYVFQLFALQAGPPFLESPGRREFIEAVLSRATAVGCVIGTYDRADRVGLDPVSETTDRVQASEFDAAVSVQ
jgi:Raf kinase inhibitor-like YbhB/YbcL family protein